MNNTADAGTGKQKGMVRAHPLVPASAGEMHWGVKASFLSYVKNSGGKTAIVLPASVTGEAFTFPRRAGEYPPGTVRFSGGVAFSAHGGMMTVILAEPAIETSSDGLWLTIADTGDITDESRRRRIARLVPANSHGNIPACSSTLTPLLAWSGVGLFGDVYAEGTAFDPLVLMAKDPVNGP
ncbi:HtaA domain-containing protein [Arthrobacter sp. efr-133-R2A-120]|uniref:HtaA domain-containing protein n=1 Tax=Arthrobacter sp. efr-133-R2A-120 TaxID=3040277 RepID=UPI00254D561A|nr:HtaA domain-containing protein [Arthrobacter sp. efr-133-R2A-120]